MVIVQSADPSEHGDQLSRNRDQRERHQAGVGRIHAYSAHIRQHLLVGCARTYVPHVWMSELCRRLDTLNRFSLRSYAAFVVLILRLFYGHVFAYSAGI